jgi:coenzyme F420-reducing hydrogenase alpha subunit
MSPTSPAVLERLEGHIRVTLSIEGGRVGRVDISAFRPQLAQRLLLGCTAREAAERVGRLYTLCGRAQRLAAEAAAEAAAGETAPAARLTQRDRLVLAEQAREHARQLLLSPHGEADEDDGLRPLRLIAKAGEDATALASAISQVLTEYVLGEAPGRWLARDPQALRRWCEAAATAAARHLALARRNPGPTVVRTPLLPALATWGEDSIRSLALQALGQPDFCVRPLWLGRPAETGALARLWGDPTLSAWLGDLGRVSAARLLARLIELARLPERLIVGGPPVVRAWSLGDGIGVAGVETARGLLLHVARMAAGRVADYRILAPTEWNFHPAGPLAEALRSMPAHAELAEHARRVVASFDPCVACQLEIRHA